MKIKNSVSSLDARILGIVFAVVSAVSVALRTYQMFNCIEPVTGFNVGPQWLMILLYAIIFAGCLVFCVFSYLSEDTAKLHPMGMKSKNTFVFALLMALQFLINWLLGVFGGVDSLSGTQSAEGFKGLMASGLLTGGLQGIFAFLSMIYMVIFAFDMRNGTVKASKFKILALAPAGWATVRLVERFLSQISFLEISDLFLELVMLSFMAMFFMAFAQVCSGVNSTGFSWRLSGIGYPAALIALTLFFSRSIISVVKGSQVLNPSFLAEAADLTFAVFVAVLVSELLKKDRVSEEV